MKGVDGQGSWKIKVLEGLTLPVSFILQMRNVMFREGQAKQ